MGCFKQLLVCRKSRRSGMRGTYRICIHRQALSELMLICPLSPVAMGCGLKKGPGNARRQNRRRACSGGDRGDVFVGVGLL
eukprot:20350_3